LSSTHSVERKLLIKSAVRDYLLPWLVLFVVEAAAIGTLAAVIRPHPVVPAAPAARRLSDHSIVGSLSPGSRLGMGHPELSIVEESLLWSR
jgi:hypothetical protein